MKSDQKYRIVLIIQSIQIYICKALSIVWLYSYPLTLIFFSIYGFSSFPTLFLGRCSKVFGSYNFFQLGFHEEVWMSSFHKLWPCAIQSCHVEKSHLEEMWSSIKFNNTILEKFISPNLEKKYSSPFYGR